MRKKLILFSLFFSVFTLLAKDYKAGEIQSKQSFHYGRFETRFYASDVSGILSTMFLFENDGWRETDIWQEIDVEVFGKDPGNIWQSNLIYQTTPDGQNLHAEETHTFANGGTGAEWHTYTIDWTPDYVEWFVDGVSIRKETDPEILDILGNKPMLLMFNCWAHEDPGWVGPLDVANIPTYQIVDYVKVYGWTDGTNFEPTPSFEDQFDNGLDNWNLSNHTFEQNYADFIPENVGTKEGNLVLAFTGNEQTGTDDATIPEDPVTSLGNHTPQNSFSVYPNPTSHDLSLTAPTQWSLYRIDGTYIKKGNSDKIDMSALQNGMYMLHTADKKFKIQKH